jgi:hypothetical protein
MEIDHAAIQNILQYPHPDRNRDTQQIIGEMMKSGILHLPW